MIIARVTQQAAILQMHFVVLRGTTNAKPLQNSIWRGLVLHLIDRYLLKRDVVILERRLFITASTATATTCWSRARLTAATLTFA